MSPRQLTVVMAALLGFCGLAVPAHAVTAVPGADEAWARLEAARPTHLQARDESDAGVRHREEVRLRYRAEGLALFDRYPDDPRRWEWFLATLNFEPGYARDPAAADRLAAKGRDADIELDIEASGKWKTIFHRRLVPLFLSARDVSSAQRTGFFGRRMMDWWRASGHAEIKGAISPKADVVSFARYLALYASEPAATESYTETMSNKFRTVLENADLSYAEECELLNGLGASPSPALRRSAAGLRRAAEVRATPLELSLVTTKGEALDLASLRGKVVLIDFWSMGCTGCVAVMPELKRIHEHFRPAGFELVSLCLDYPKYGKEIDAIVARIGAGWPTAYVPYDPQRGRSPLVEQFAIVTVPRYMLLDKTGRLVARNYNSGAIGHKKLEQDIARLLAANP